MKYLFSSSSSNISTSRQLNVSSKLETSSIKEIKTKTKKIIELRVAVGLGFEQKFLLNP
jgi:hypothetical protein